MQTAGTRIGILALQGGFAAHATRLRQLGVEPIYVRYPEQLADLDGLILPGGESTTMMKMIDRMQMKETLRSFGGALLGTCAGLILLKELGFLDLRLTRNGYGPQIHSFAQKEGLFIRAPIIEEICDPQIEILTSLEKSPILIRKGRVIGATFHPELTTNTSVHQEFLSYARENGSLHCGGKPHLQSLSQ